MADSVCLNDPVNKILLSIIKWSALIFLVRSLSISNLVYLTFIGFLSSVDFFLFLKILKDSLTLFEKDEKPFLDYFNL